MEDIENHFSGKLYSHLKSELAEIIVESLRPVQEEYYRIMKDKSYLNGIIKNGKEKASYRARKTLSKVYRKIGLVPMVS